MKQPQTTPKPEDECAYCGDSRRQHDERGCRACRDLPTVGVKCDGFKEIYNGI